MKRATHIAIAGSVLVAAALLYDVTPIRHQYQQILGSGPVDHESVGEPLPEFAMTEVRRPGFARMRAAKQHSLSDYSGDVVVVNFWATWCKGCVVEMPMLSRLADEFDSEAQFLAVVFQDLRSNVEDYMRAESQPEFPVLLGGPVDLSRQLRLATLPATAVVDRAGVVRYWFGGYANEEKLRSAIAAVVNES